ncbi:hypothetical protein SDC9_49767 [bioreactor metagenome]|uniref:Uncharacterized protein n=1 Tax=bioreactor metagenome TaxID=1076179 RepID=A0A644WIB4_9ZZZZ
MASGHVGESVEMASVPDPAALAAVSAVGVEQVEGGEAGAGDAGGVAPAAGDAPAVVLVPERRDEQFGGHLLHGGNGHLFDILLHELRGKGRRVSRGKEFRELRILHLRLHGVLPEPEGRGIIIRYVASHGDAEAVFEGFPALDHKKVELLPPAAVIGVSGAAVLEKHGVEAPESVDVTGTEEDDGLPVVLQGRLGEPVAGEVKKGLVRGKDYLLRRHGGFLPGFQVVEGFEGSAGHQVGAEEPPLPLQPLRSPEGIFSAEGMKNGSEALPGKGEGRHGLGLSLPLQPPLECVCEGLKMADLLPDQEIHRRAVHFLRQGVLHRRVEKDGVLFHGDGLFKDAAVVIPFLHLRLRGEDAVPGQHPEIVFFFLRHLPGLGQPLQDLPETPGMNAFHGRQPREQFFSFPRKPGRRVGIEPGSLLLQEYGGAEHISR